ncbi:MAG: TVP38/TMEM64 family protein, partial [Nitrospinaceae bacterium]|nr:TVP38/TMEM64 family protein [Nitrospinaceae bacterium]
MPEFLKRFAPLVVLAAGLGAFFALGLDRYLSFGALRENRFLLIGLVEAYGFAAAVAYMVLYAAVVAFSIPGGLVMSISGGFLFGALWGTLYIVVGATVGATILFII